MDAEKVSNALRDRLARANPGDIVLAEPGTYYGPFEIPRGVSLKTTGDGSVKLVYDKPGFVVKMHSYDDPPTSIQDVEIESDASVAIMLVGDKDVVLNNLDVTCYKGFGLAAQDVASASLTNLRLSGHIDQADSVSYPIDPNTLPAVGMAFSSARNVQMSGVDVSGFAGFGAILNDTTGSWASSLIEDNIGVGVFLDGSDMTMNEVDIAHVENCKLISCSASNQVFALSATGGSSLTSSNLRIEENEGIGLLINESTGAFENLSVQDNSGAGVWLQDVSSQGERKGFSLKGESNTIAGNSGAALVVHSSDDIEIEDTTLSGTTLLPISTGEVSVTEWGDGIHAVELAGTIAMKRLQLANNERIGVLLSGSTEEEATVEIEEISITGSGTYGFRAQAGIERDATWDEELTIDETLEENDASLAEDLAITIPQSVMPSLGLVMDQGLIGNKGLIAETGELTGSFQIQNNGAIGETDAGE